LLNTLTRYWEVRLAIVVFCLFVNEMRARFFGQNKKICQNFHQKIAKRCPKTDIPVLSK
jgi:hypothetical protein